MNTNTAKVAALVLDNASAYNEKRVGAALICRTVAAEPEMFAGLSGADILDFIAGMLDSGRWLESAAIALSSLVRACRDGLVSAETMDEACIAHYHAPEGDMAIERAGSVIFVATLVA